MQKNLYLIFGNPSSIMQPSINNNTRVTIVKLTLKIAFGEKGISFLDGKYCLIFVQSS